VQEAGARAEVDAAHARDGSGPVRQRGAAHRDARTALQAQNAQGKETGGTVVTAFKSAYDDLTKQLGATSEDRSDTQQDLNDAEKQAAKAQDDADAAKQQAADATSETEKANAEAAQAQAELDTAQAKAQIAADCAKAYITAIGGLFEGSDVAAAAANVKQDVQGIT